MKKILLARGLRVNASAILRKVAVTAFPILASVLSAQVFVPASNRVDVEYDYRARIVYISSSDGSILRYNTDTSSFLSPWSVGGAPVGMSLSPDGTTLAVANSSFTGQTWDSPSSDLNKNWVDLINVTDGSTRHLTFQRQFGETGTFMPSFTDNNTLLLTSSFGGSGWSPLRKIDVATGTATTLASVRQDTMLAVSADRSTLAYAESNISSGSFGLYNTQTFAQKGGSTNWFDFEIAINRNGTQVAVPTYGGTFIYNQNLQRTGSIGTYANQLPIGAAYSPNQDLLYLAWSDWSHQHAGIDVYDTNSLTPVSTLDSRSLFNWVGNHAFQEGRLDIAGDGSYLFATVAGGIDIYQLAAVPEPTTYGAFASLGLIGLMAWRRRKAS